MSVKLLLARIVSRFSNFYKAHVFWRKIDRALALHQRGEVRSDGLQLISAQAILRIEWLARSIHPWDRDLPTSVIERLFAEQCLADTDAAINRLFAEVPILNTIEICVRRDSSRPPILKGTVHRELLTTRVQGPIGMRLRTIGIGFRLHDLCLEEIEAS